MVTGVNYIITVIVQFWFAHVREIMSFNYILMSAFYFLSQDGNIFNQLNKKNRLQQQRDNQIISGMTVGDCLHPSTNYIRTKTQSLRYYQSRSPAITVFACRPLKTRAIRSFPTLGVAGLAQYEQILTML